MRKIAVLNQKGGVGKTTTVANLGAALAGRGLRVLLIDLDPQAHLTLHYGIDSEALDLSLYDVLVEGAPAERVLLHPAENVSLIPSDIDLAAAELELASVQGRESILQRALVPLANQFDWLLIDCPPSLSVLTINALAAVDEVIIPLQPHFLALQGLGKLLETVSLIRDRMNPSLTVRGIVLCMYEAATKLAGEVVEDLKQFLESSRGQSVPWADARLFQTTVRRNIKLAECPSHGKTIFDYAGRSPGAFDYAALAAEIADDQETAAVPVDGSTAHAPPSVTAESR